MRYLTFGHAASKAGAVVLALCASMIATLAYGAQPRPSESEFLTTRGAYLAKVGDCAACHTAPRGVPFAGGLRMVTPMGGIYTTNITPDAETGIGRYSEEQFSRALRNGVARDGHRLYPAMPYPSYAKLHDDDVKALYAYFMHGVQPVKQVNRASDIPWPFNARWPLILWNAIFLDTKPYRDKTTEDARWNRGAYLVQGLGHCGSCHTPRGIGFQEKALDEGGLAFLSGAALDHWFASNLTGDPNTGLGRWNEEDVAEFLKHGANRHATAFGSMVSVVNHSTQALTDRDLAAIARYLKSLPVVGDIRGPLYRYDSSATQAALTRPANDSGARVYNAYCLHCHGADGRGYAPLLAPLAGNPNVLANDASSLINVTLNGTDTLVIDGVPSAYPMPAFANVLTDRQIADALTFVRAGWNNGAPPVRAADVARLRAATTASR